jgi:hypothetical protein
MNTTLTRIFNISMIVWIVSYDLNFSPNNSWDGIVPFEKRGSYIWWPSESNGSNLFDEPLKGFIVKPICPLGPCKPRAFGDHDSQWKCTTSVECKTGISAVLTDTSGLGNSYRINDHYWIVLNLCFCYSLFTLHDHMFMTICCYSYVKTLLTKSYVQLNPCHAFWAS